MDDRITKHAKRWRFCLDKGADLSRVMELGLDSGMTIEEATAILELAKTMPPFPIIRTKEDLPKLTRAELDRLIPEYLQDGFDDSLRLEFSARLVEITPDVTEMVDNVAKAFQAGDLSDAPFEPIRKLSDMALICAWSRMTQRSSSELDFAKHVHQRLVGDVLRVFAVPVGSPGKGVAPDIMFARPWARR